MSSPDTELRYSRRGILAVSASAGVGALVLRGGEAFAADGSDDAVSNWVVARLESPPSGDALEAELLPTERLLHIQLSPRAPATRPDGQPQTAYSIGETFVAEGTSRLEEDGTEIVALRLVPAVIGDASDVQR
jgi:hypothetical protein